MSGEVVYLPGQPVPSSSRTASVAAGSGAYRRGDHILFSTVEPSQSSTGRGGIRSIEVGYGASSSSSGRLVVPQPGSRVLGRVTRVNQRQANVSILVVDGRPCAPGDWSACGFTNHAAGEDPTGADFTGVIRVQDVRATEKDKVRMADCFRPGDIVAAVVISLGDARSYFLSTAENSLGVVYALPSPAPGALHAPGSGANEADTAAPLEVVSWQEMRDPVTGQTEKRKVAKPAIA